MTDNRDEKLEEMLRSRRMEPSSPDLAERIVLKAQGIPQNQMPPLAQWVRRLFAEFHLPRPAYVLACTLMVGLVVGFNAHMDITPDDTDSAHVESFLYADEDVL